MITLPYGYVLDADSSCYTLGKPLTVVNKKTGKEEVVVSQAVFFKSIEKALEWLYERQKRKAVERTPLAIFKPLYKLVQTLPIHSRRTLRKCWGLVSQYTPLRR